MEIKTVRVVYFSPTGTTKSIASAVARGFVAAELKCIDITSPKSRNSITKTESNELLIVGVPVYMGRVPALLSDWFAKLEARDTPAVCLAVYGNREFDDALLELKELLISRGCVPVAAAAYIGEHSFADSTLPIALGRPDAADIDQAEQFGRLVKEKLLNCASTDCLSELSIPGNHPYGGITELWDMDFISVGINCTGCGTCAIVCPMAAIDPTDSRSIDIKKCITCCACIKSCPQGSRSKKESPVLEAARRLSTRFPERKQPAEFI